MGVLAMVEAFRSLPPVPVLHTPRLELRGHRASDLPDCAAMWGDPEVVRYVGGRPCTQEEVWARILRYVGHWALLGYGYWAIIERGSGRYVGEAGLGDGHRGELEPAWGHTPEAGWALSPWAQGRGLATEAVAAVLRWGDAMLPGGRTVAMIEPDNRASLRVAAKVGFREYAKGRYKGDAMILLERVVASRA
jgi:RimJ/RimL family protein N-acetyltransferase